MPYNDVRKAFGVAIKHWRAKAGISQEELAWRASLHRSYIADIERGARNASLQTIEKLSNALQVSFSTLLAPVDSLLEAEGQAAPKRPSNLAEILLAENNARHSEQILAAFQQACLINPVHTVTDGTQVLAFIDAQRGRGRHSVSRPPQLLLLSLTLPKGQSLEVVRSLKAKEHTRDICIILLTPSPRDERLKAAARLGVEASITQPLTFQNFAESTRRLPWPWALLYPSALLDKLPPREKIR